MIDWSKLKPYQGDQRHSFEEVCYQVAKGLYGDEGAFTSVDDSGGGDGVEFYLTLPDGAQWGWQAKFYYPNERFSESGRKDSIKDSLVTACKKHPRLTKWFLCTPTNLTPKERTWFVETLPGSIPNGLNVELAHWGDSDFNEWLGEPRFAGKRHYFFGDLELNLGWFQQQFSKQRASLGDKFNPELHTKTRVDARIHAMLGDDTQAKVMKERQTRLKINVTNFDKDVNELQSYAGGFDWGDIKQPVLVAAAEIRSQFEVILEEVDRILEYLEHGQITELQKVNFEDTLENLRHACAAYVELAEGIDVNALLYKGDPKTQGESVREALEAIHALVPGHAESFLDNLQSLRRSLEGIRTSDFHILGGAGTGKTHITCHICEERLTNQYPALFLRGSTFFSDAPLNSQLLTLLDVPANYSWGNFLAALDAAAQAHRTRIPIVIDGLNESVVAGTFSPVWREHLPELVAEIKAHSNLALITSYRSTYEDTIWPSGKPVNREQVAGFVGANTLEEAIRKYFAFYRISADLTGAPLEQFHHPIYLRLFCETKNPSRNEKVRVYLGEQTLFEVFDEYFGQVNLALTKKLSLRPSVDVINVTIEKIAEYLWANHTRTMPLDGLARAIDGVPLDQLKWDGSRTKALEDEGLLIYRDMQSGQEIVAFTYDLIGGYAVARYLLNVHGKDIENFLTSGETRQRLFDHGETTSEQLLGSPALHPLFDDIRRGLAAILPAQTGLYLHNIFREGPGFSVGINALFEMQPRYVDDNCLEVVTQLFEKGGNRIPLLKRSRSTVGHVGHPMNVDFWDKLLCNLSMPERDLSWSEYVRQNSGTFDRFLREFENASRRSSNASGQSDERLNLFAKYAMWLLTTTVRSLRDKATRALYYYGRSDPESFLALLESSFKVNDPYVSERMLAAAYGVTMARLFDFQDANFVNVTLPKLGRSVFDRMFADGATHSTPHALARSYARQTVELALAHRPSLLTEKDTGRLHRLLTSDEETHWREFAPENGHYLGGSGGDAMHMDFANYTVGRLVPDRRNYDFEDPEYVKVYQQISWRMHDLGYQQALFEKIDARLAEGLYNRSNSGSGGVKTDRYGKKYAWIAYFELYGLRKDLGLLEGKFTFPEGRSHDVDIDPSFPEPVTQHQLVQESLLGDVNSCLEAWIENGVVPDVSPFLVVDSLTGVKEPWVLLDGYVSQRNQAAQRSQFVFIRGLIVSSQDADAILERLTKQDLGGRWLPEIGEDDFTYAGEVPWSEMFGISDEHELSFIVGQRTVVSEATAPFAVETNAEAMVVSVEGAGEATIAEYKTNEYELYKVRLPVRRVGWGGDTSAANPRYSACVPTKEIASRLDLCSQPQTSDLYEKNGRRASICIEFADNSDRQRFTFLRKDLFDRYLAETGSAFLWAAWGERERYHEAPLSLRPIDGATYKGFQCVKSYKELT